MAESVITSAASSVISSALNSIGKLAWNEIIFLRDVPNQVQLIDAKLKIIQGFLKDAENKPQRNHMTENWLREIRRVAYRAQDVIEKINCLKRRNNQTIGCTRIFSRYSKIPDYLKSLHEIGEEIVKINEFIPGMADIKANLSGVNLEEGSSMTCKVENQPDTTTTIHIIEEDEVVGFDIEIRSIVNELLDPANEQLSVVSILGMGGCGKSTLARKIFSHSDVKTEFDIKIWITISQQYNIQSLQHEILKAIFPREYGDVKKLSVDQPKGNISSSLKKLSAEEAKEKISNSLKEKKYLIVIDDIWTIKSWDDINSHCSNFPNMNNGSRVILTSRNLEVGNHPAVKIFIHELKPLDDEKSWELLKKKAFPTYVTLTDLERNKLECLGPQLVEKCKGLPLALIVLGGYLSKHLDYETWSRMSENVEWNEAGNQINISEILALSYHDLPNHLKPIFLYTAAFPEDAIIKSNDLIKLWIAEEFIQSQKYKLETVAQMYINQLYERGLIQVVRKNRTLGRISRIRIHDVLRDWGIKRAKEEGLFDVIKRSDHATSFDSYRVAFYGDCDENVTVMSHLRSFLGFALPAKKTYLRDSNSLRVVRYIVEYKDDNKGISKLPKRIKHMMFLRYLCMQNCGKIYFPSSIGQLYNLETLQCILSEIWSLPSSLWKISTLRHVHLEWIYCNWNGPKKGCGKNIQTLIICEDWGFEFRNATVGLMYTHMDGVVAALEEMKQIVHLSLDPGGRDFCGNVLSILSGHRHLEVLQLLMPIKGLTRIPDASVFPPNILKLELNCFELERNPIPVLEKLPKLVVLKLSYSNYFRSIHCKVGGFRQLKYLRITNFISDELKVDDGAMPNLHHLKLLVCKNLKMFPEGLMEHRQLQLLEMGDVPHLYEVDYSRLQNKGCKVVLAKERRDSSLSWW